MDFRRYLKDRWKTIVLLVCSIFTIEIILLLYPVHGLIRLYIGAVPFATFLFGTFLEYYPKKRFYQDTEMKLAQMHEKYMIFEMLDVPESVEEELLEGIIRVSNKAMIEKINEYKHIQKEYQEYVELWIHEIKIPIATAKMIIENNRNTVTKSIGEELEEIEHYTEQALYYARSSNANQDYYITECRVKELVTEAIKKNKQGLIRNKIRIRLEEMDGIVYTDPKWCQFILTQIIDNTIKYKKESDAEIHFWIHEQKNSIRLHIRDNGIGIRAGEVRNVFDKGFTGTNGRTGRKSTGIGLYLCKILCDKLGLGIEVQSEEHKWCEVTLIFPKNDFFLSA